MVLQSSKVRSSPKVIKRPTTALIPSRLRSRIPRRMGASLHRRYGCTCRSGSNRPPSQLPSRLPLVSITNCRYASQGFLFRLSAQPTYTGLIRCPGDCICSLATQPGRLGPRRGNSHRQGVLRTPVVIQCIIQFAHISEKPKSVKCFLRKTQSSLLYAFSMSNLIAMYALFFLFYQIQKETIMNIPILSRCTLKK